MVSPQATHHCVVQSPTMVWLPRHKNDSTGAVVILISGKASGSYVLGRRDGSLHKSTSVGFGHTKKIVRVCRDCNGKLPTGCPLVSASYKLHPLCKKTPAVSLENLVVDPSISVLSAFSHHLPRDVSRANCSQVRYKCTTDLYILPATSAIQ